MILYAWRNTDPEFDATKEMRNVPPKMVADIQFNFNSTAQCERSNCDRHAFIRCAHCGKLLCLQHFLERTCFHNLSRVRRSLDGSEGEDECDTECQKREEHEAKMENLQDDLKSLYETGETIANFTGLVRWRGASRRVWPSRRVNPE